MLRTSAEGYNPKMEKPGFKPGFAILFSHLLAASRQWLFASCFHHTTLAQSKGKIHRERGQALS